MCSHLKDFEVTLLKFWLQGQRHLDGLSFSTWVFGLCARRVFSQEKFDNWFCQRRKVFTSVLAAIPSRVQCCKHLWHWCDHSFLGNFNSFGLCEQLEPSKHKNWVSHVFGHSMWATSTDQTQKLSFTFFWSHNEETFFYPGQLLRYDAKAPNCHQIASKFVSTWDLRPSFSSCVPKLGVKLARFSPPSFTTYSSHSKKHQKQEPVS